MTLLTHLFVQTQYFFNKIYLPISQIFRQVAVPTWPSKPSVKRFSTVSACFHLKFPQGNAQNLSMPHHRHKHQHSGNSNTCHKLPLMESLTASLKLLFMISRSYALLCSFCPPSACHHHLPIILLPFVSKGIEVCHFFQCAPEPAQTYLHNYLRKKKIRITFAIFGSYASLCHNTDK